MNAKKILIFMVASISLTSVPASLRAQSISMAYVTIGNPGNLSDPATGSLYGSVSYTYDIGEYDVTDTQYCTFLNDVDPTGANSLGLYDSSATDAEYGILYNSGATTGAKYSIRTGYTSMPVVDVDYWDTLRFVNWMNNGEGSASTETGAYTLLGATPTPSNSSSLLANPQPNAGATVWLPSENEWYKAAYYDPALNSGSGGYWTYATQSDTTPGNIVGNGANVANYYTGKGYSVTQSSSYSSHTNYLTAVGSYTDSASYYGTYDQSGDVFNWTDTTLNSFGAVVRGGGWLGNAYSVSSVRETGTDGDPWNQIPYGGFRVASVPEPTTAILLLAGILGVVVHRRKVLLRSPG